MIAPTSPALCKNNCEELAIYLASERASHWIQQADTEWGIWSRSIYCILENRKVKSAAAAAVAVQLDWPVKLYHETGRNGCR